MKPKSCIQTHIATTDGPRRQHPEIHLISTTRTAEREPCHEDARRTGIRGLSLEILGKDFNPHLARRVVGTHVIRILPGPDGINLASKLLGNTRTTVMKSYASEDSDAAHDTYLEKLLSAREANEERE